MCTLRWAAIGKRRETALEKKDDKKEVKAVPTAWIRPASRLDLTLRRTAGMLSVGVGAFVALDSWRSPARARSSGRLTGNSVPTCPAQMAADLPLA